ncbi:membrane protein US15 [Panine betaherpesvirus 2]|uniref:Membrane protein US15 n=1 Tax=Panine betaherpesvirus 2 TaxID=188763 RepID=Q8QRU4_9BETA|nr:membrane protein US15 [Panine betaherpesvirus 2]AAM00794.1 membrane protein US15 [Panine betaherpesvirus 2]QXV67912.1 membrane protein US15 [Panine betaherpesvirus 2]
MRSPVLTDKTAVYLPPRLRARLTARSLAWVYQFRVTVYTYGAVVFQVAGTLSLLLAFAFVAPSAWRQHPRLCFTEGSPSLTFLVPFLAVLCLYCAEKSHPPKVSVLLFYTLINLPPLAVACLCISPFQLLAASLFTLTGFATFTGLALLARDHDIRRQIVLVHVLVTLAFVAALIVISLREGSWYLKVISGISVLIACLALSHFHETALAVRYETPLARTPLAAAKVFLNLVFSLLMVLRILTLRTFLQTYFPVSES